MPRGPAHPDEPVGTFVLVLHTHLPWLAHHGSWPVGEEWLHQAWSSSYLPLVDVLTGLAEDGHRDVASLGITPVVAAMLDDPHCLREQHTWLGFWAVNALALASDHDPRRRALGAREHLAAARAIDRFESSWRNGGSAVLRPLVDAGVVELLGGPATHPFLPLLDPQVAAFALRTGLDDAVWRLGRRPGGIWAPECGYRPGLEHLYAEAGVTHLVVDAPTLESAGRSTADAWRIGATDVVAVGRDHDISYRVWNPRTGYPAGPWYRDFHTFDHGSGFRPARVTSTGTPPHEKEPYDDAAAKTAALVDAADFVEVVRRRLVELRDERDGRPGLVMAAFDTELFGHWWHEGPVWLDAVLRTLPAAGVRVASLRGAIDAGAVAGRVDPGPGSWGSGKDWRVWAGEQVADLGEDNAVLQERLLLLAEKNDRATTADPALDQLARQALLALASDWAFMVTNDSATAYARARHAGHHASFRRIADLLDAGRVGGRARGGGPAARVRRAVPSPGCPPALTGVTPGTRIPRAHRPGGT